MTRIAAVVFTAVLGVLAITGCNKPSEEACRKAITNMRSLMGTDSPTANVDVNGDVRRCKGGSKKKAVECAGNAKTLDELRACDFMKIPHTPAGSDSGSAAAVPPSGSAAPATGSDTGAAGTPPPPTGSAAPSGSDTGTGSGSAAGSGASTGSATDTGAAGTGSAATGSAATGSAAGTGAAAGSGSAAAAPAGSATR